MARRPTDVPAPVKGIGAPPGQFLAGRWVGSFSGFICNSPAHPKSYEIPQLPAFIFQQNSFRQVQGFFPCAAILGIEFAAEGTLIGEYAMNSATRVTSELLEGHFTLAIHDSLGIHVGTFLLVFTQSATGIQITQEFSFMMCGRDELHFLSLRSTKLEPGANPPPPSRVTIGQGKLHRIRGN